MGAPERKVELALARGAARRGWLCWKLTSPDLKGVPDRLVIADGVCAFVECKSATGALRPQQRLRLSELAAHTQATFVVSTPEEAASALDAIAAISARATAQAPEPASPLESDGTSTTP